MKTLNDGNFEVVVVGSGITGLSAVHHLQCRGVRRIGLITSSEQIGISSKSAGILSGGPWDNYSRLTQNHGLEFAKTLLQIMRSSFIGLSDEIRRCGVPMVMGKRFRLITSDHEMNEAQIAVQQLNEAGFPSAIQKASTNGQWGKGVMGIQDEGINGAICGVPLFLQSWQREFKVKNFVGDVNRVDQKDGQVLISFRDGRQLKSVMVVLACHAAIPLIMPALQEVLIPYVDQWSIYSVKSSAVPTYFAPGNVISANHGNEWGGIDASGKIRWGGARYLRPLAGIGSWQGQMSAKITEHLEHRLQEYIQKGVIEKTDGGESFVDFWPCDELPVIGPMYGNEQILIASGFMGQGLIWGYFAGKVLAELITTGKCATLPPRLTPKRFRSLE